MMEPSRCSLPTQRNLVSIGGSRDGDVCIDHIHCSEEPKVQLNSSGYVATPLREAHRQITPAGESLSNLQRLFYYCSKMILAR